MQQVLDLNAYRRPELLLIMKDEAATPVHITTPTVALTEELRDRFPELQEVFQGKGEKTSRAIYDLAAKLINCNLDFIEVTGDELATKYRLNIEDLTIFFNAYVDFLGVIQKAKN